MGDKLPGSKYGFEMVDGNREPFYLKMTDFILDLKSLISLLPKEGLIWKQYETKRLVEKICERLKNSEIKTRLLMIKELVEKRQIGAAQKMINDLREDKDLERMIDESLGAPLPVETHKSHFNFKKWATVGIAAIIGAVTFGHYKPAFADTYVLYAKDGTNAVCVNNQCTPSDNPNAPFVGVGNVVRDPRTGKEYVGQKIQDQRREESTQPERTAQSHINERITDVNDYMRRAGEELNSGNYDVAQNMYGAVIQKSQEKKIKLSRNQLYQAYYGIAMSFKETNDKQNALKYFKLTARIFPEKKNLIGIINYIERN